MPPTPFGEHLKRERELRGVSLDEISAATRIKTSFLEALEEGRWKELPGGAFNRGFVRATARFLGLDEDAMVAEYALETGGPVEAKSAAELSGAMPRDYRPAMVAGSVVLVLLIAIIWLAHHEIYVHRQKKAAMAGLSAAGSAPGAQNTVTPAPSSAVAPTEAPDGAQQASAPGGGQPAPPVDGNAGQPATAPATSGSSRAALSANASAAAPEVLKLRLETTKTTEIRVIGDGKTLFKGRLHSDDPKFFQSKNGFEVSSGDAGVVKLQLNGEDVAFGGKPGHHGSVTLTRDNLKSSSDSAH